MRRSLVAPTLILAVVAGTMLVPVTGLAQGQQQIPMPPSGFKPPPPAPIKPYQPVAVTLPVAFSDPAFAAFHKQLAEAAEHKDKAALAKLVVAQGFFWIQEKDLADKHKPGIASLSKALELDAKDSDGWAMLANYANDPTGEPIPDKPNVICGPAEPKLDPKAFEALLKATSTEPPEWGVPLQEGLEVRSVAKPDAPVVEKLGLVLVRVLPDSAPPDATSPPTFLHIATPSGKSGFVPIEALSSLGGDQMCYTKEGGNWKITGYFGGAAQ
jgi:hypothetical protein